MTYSVAIPAYNAARTIAETITSVLQQTVPPQEIIVVDDGSTDNTAEVAEHMSDMVRVLRQENRGAGAAFTRAVKATCHQVIASVDADDLWVPHKMEQQLSVLSKARTPTLIFGQHRRFRHGSDDFQSGAVNPGWGRSDMVMTRTIFDMVGEVIDPPGQRGEMIDWLARAREMGIAFHCINDVLVLRRIIPGSLSYGRDPAKDRGYLNVVHQALKRRHEQKERAENG